MSEKTIRLGVVGCGYNPAKNRGGRGFGVFRQACEGFDGVAAAAACDLLPEALENARKVFPEIACHEDYDQMLDESGVDALIIGTPATCHAEFAAKALAKNVHVLSEIPSVTSLEEANLLWNAHQKSDAIYMTGSNANFRGYIDAAVDLKRRGILGEPIYMESEYIHDVQSYFDRTTWRANYMPIKYCTHSLGPLLRLIDEDFVSATCFDTGGKLNGDPEQHDFMAALFRTPSGVVTRFVASFINEAGFHYWNYRVFTDKGMFERTSPQYTSMGYVPAESPRTLFYSKELPLTTNRVELPIGDMPPAYANNPKAKGHGGVDYAMLDAFFKAVRTGGPSPISLRDGLRMSLPGVFAAESARRGGELVEIKYPWSTS